MHLKDILLVIVDGLSGLFCLLETLLEGEGEEVWFEVELESSRLDEEFTGRDFDVR